MRLRTILGALLLGLVFAPGFAPAQEAAAAVAEEQPLKQEELEQMLASLALYPDSLLTQILMASTYPIEIVQADRWVKANKDLQGEALTAELEKQEWDPSVKSLVNFPDVLAALSEQLDWTTKIGDAFIADQKRVMDTIQALRGKAQTAGNLQTTEQQKVIVEQQGSSQIIVIEPAQPDVVYVPSYDPVVVYGGWSYPSYPPPVYYRTPIRTAAAGMMSFGAGVACGAAWGYAWGKSNWGGGDIDIDVNRNANFNQNINRNNYNTQVNRNNANISNNRNSWQHNAEHRKGVAYRDTKAAQHYGGTSNKQAVQARQAYRGQAETGRQNLQQPGASQQPSRGTNNQGRGSAQQTAGQRDVSPARSGAGQSPSYSSQNQRSGASQSSSRGSSAQNRSSSSQSKSSAFSDSNRSGQQSRASSQRGQSSRSQSSAASHSRSSGGGSKGGGGSRGGGGRGR